MQKLSKAAIAVMAASVLLAFFWSCAGPGSMDGAGGLSPGYGALQLNLSTPLKTINPPLSMDVTNYDVSILNGPSSPIVFNTSDASAQTEVLPGNYDVGIVGKNAAGDALGDGSGNYDVTVGNTTIATIIVSEYGGFGDLHVDLGWTTGIVETPTLEGVLEDALGGQTAIPYANIDPVAGTADFDMNLLWGWYAVITRIVDNDSSLAGGFATCARVVANYTTTGNVFLDLVENLGVIQIDVILNFYDALNFTGTPAEGVVDVSGGGLFNFSVVEDDAIPFSGVWYVNGESVDTGTSTTIDADSLLPGENYRLDLIGFSLDAQHAADASWTLSR